MSEMTKDLVKQGLTAARVGDVPEARRLLTQATQQQPDNVEAWLALAGVVDSLDYKQKCFKKALEIEPDNPDARDGLALVEEKLAARQQSPAPTPDPVFAPQTESGLGVCYRHPEVETGLRCNKCGNYICTKCAVRTPVGFRCPNCIREQEDKYYTGGNFDYVIAAIIALPLSAITAFLFTRILVGFGFFMLIIGFFVAPAIVGFIAEAVRWGVSKRRSRYLRYVVSASLVVGALPSLLWGFMAAGFWGLLLPGMFIFLGLGVITARLR